MRAINSRLLRLHTEWEWEKNYEWESVNVNKWEDEMKASRNDDEEVFKTSLSWHATRFGARNRIAFSDNVLLTHQCDNIHIEEIDWFPVRLSPRLLCHTSLPSTYIRLLYIIFADLFFDAVSLRLDLPLPLSPDSRAALNTQQLMRKKVREN